MKFNGYKRNCIILFLILSIFVLQGVAQQQQQQQQQKEQPQKEEEERPKNLKVLSKKMNEEEIHALMRTYAKSLGVKCGHCHAQSKTDPKHLDLASDENPKKNIARKMIKMTADINKKYIAKIGDNKFGTVACVTCHMGHTKPTFSVDSLVKNIEKQ